MSKHGKRFQPADLSGPALMRKIREAVESDQLYFTDHAREEMKNDGISHADARRVAKTGIHNASKDTYDLKRGSWKYAIDGKDVDGRALRLIITLYPALGGVVVTAFRLYPGKSN